MKYIIQRRKFEYGYCVVCGVVCNNNCSNVCPVNCVINGSESESGEE